MLQGTLGCEKPRLGVGTCHGCSNAGGGGRKCVTQLYVALVVIDHLLKFKIRPEELLKEPRDPLGLDPWGPRDPGTPGEIVGTKNPGKPGGTPMGRGGPKAPTRCRAVAPCVVGWHANNRVWTRRRNLVFRTPPDLTHIKISPRSVGREGGGGGGGGGNGSL